MKLDVGQVIKVGEEFLVVIQRDFHKNEIIVKAYPSFEEADEFMHECSVRQNPEWHALNCFKCKTVA